MNRVAEVWVKLRAEEESFHGLLSRVGAELSTHGTVIGVHAGHYGFDNAMARFNVRGLRKSRQLLVGLP